jgi:hypothetical protein
MSLRDHPNCQMGLLGAAECQWRPQSYFMNCLHFILLVAIYTTVSAKFADVEFAPQIIQKIQKIRSALHSPSMSLFFIH